ncbi:hypothetical protein AB0K52_08990 [Glycomyces sp. NPDC049804]|uniref:hypothetical protein n=1 Tax=Glycomyces sp. NPDC049804 TaxID=3154363 RepID=UPI0034351F8B
MTTDDPELIAANEASTPPEADGDTDTRVADHIDASAPRPDNPRSITFWATVIGSLAGVVAVVVTIIQVASLPPAELGSGASGTEDSTPPAATTSATPSPEATLSEVATFDAEDLWGHLEPGQEITATNVNEGGQDGLLIYRGAASFDGCAGMLGFSFVEGTLEHWGCRFGAQAAVEGVTVDAEGVLWVWEFATTEQAAEAATAMDQEIDAAVDLTWQLAHASLIELDGDFYTNSVSFTGRFVIATTSAFAYQPGADPDYSFSVALGHLEGDVRTLLSEST